MMMRWKQLHPRDNEKIFHMVYVFLQGRLQERETVNWALGLNPEENPEDRVKRLAVLEVLDQTGRHTLKEPWRSAWQWIEESWNYKSDSGLGDYEVQPRLREGELSGALIDGIVQNVAPRLKLGSVAVHTDVYDWGWFVQEAIPEPISPRRPKSPKRLEDLLSVTLASGEMLDPSVLNLDAVSDGPFLSSLAFALEVALNKGLDIAKRLGWGENYHPWSLGVPSRVEYLAPSRRVVGCRDFEPDSSWHGITPSVKLLHAVVTRLVELDISAATAVVRRWKSIDSPVHPRLWAALSRDVRVTPAEEVGEWLLGLNDWVFWDMHRVYDYPEIPELRARRFFEFDHRKQTALLARLQKLPPRRWWRSDVASEKIRQSRIRRAVLALADIETLNTAPLPQKTKAWMENRLLEFPCLLHDQQANKSSEEIDGKIYDSLAGEKLLEVLETDLSNQNKFDRVRAAAIWISKPENLLNVLAVFELAPNAGSGYSNVWKQFLLRHRSESPEVQKTIPSIQRDFLIEGFRVLSLLEKVSDKLLQSTIQQIAQWLLCCGEQLMSRPDRLSKFWLRLWPFALAVNESEVTFRSSENANAIDADTINTAAGQLTRVFLLSCPKTVRAEDAPFEHSPFLRSMRDAIKDTPESAEALVKYQLIAAMPYFLKADRQWTVDNLIPPLLADMTDTPKLWRSLTRQAICLPDKVVGLVGDKMAERAADFRLDREVRNHLVYRLVLDSLYAYLNGSELAVSTARLQQMIRSIDDEARMYGANTLLQFLDYLSKPSAGTGNASSRSHIFKTAIAPFIDGAWPHDYALIKPETSRSFARLAVDVEEAFAEAVEAVEHFLVPIHAGSMADYGFDLLKRGKARYAFIDTPKKAAALLRLFDLTTGAETCQDITGALEHIRSVDPDLAKTPAFRRLMAAARRG